MNPEVCSGTNVLFQILSSDLNASLATADELSREFNCLMKECSSDGDPQPNTGSKEKQQKCPETSCPTPTPKKDEDTSSTGPMPLPPPPLVTEASPRSPNPLAFDSKPLSSSPVFSPSYQLTPPLSRKDRLSPTCGLQSLTWHSPQTRRRVFQYDSVPRDRAGSPFLERSPSPCASPLALDQPLHLKPHASPAARSPRLERRTPPHLTPPGALLRGSPTGSEVGMRRQKTPAERTENGSDTVYGRKPLHATDRAERLRAYGSLDSSSPTIHKFQPKASLPHNMRLNPERSSSPRPLSPYSSPTLSRKASTPPSPPRPRWHHPVPLSVIMRAQKPLVVLPTRHPRAMDLSFLQQHPPPSVAAEMLRQAGRLGLEKHMEEEGDPGAIPRPRSPTPLPSLSPEAPGYPELRLLRSEIPRALKRRGGLNQPLPLVHRRQYQQMISRLVASKDLLHKAELGSESSSSSEGEESPRTPAAAPPIPVLVTAQHKGLQSILKRPRRSRKSSGRRARLSPLVLLLDGALEGELDTVQRAAKEMSNPSQSNEEGVTALHNAICGGHDSIVEFLVRNGANVSAPDSHGWTPLHCAAACNDRSMCEFLVRSGAAVLSVTEGDGATAVQKCDPFAVGFEECTGFLRGVEDAMGVENSGVLYALWGYPAQASDELSFREGDTVTIKKKQEGAEWWWASLGNREGFVPSNYFALFPKVRPRSLQDQNQKGR